MVMENATHVSLPGLTVFRLSKIVFDLVTIMIYFSFCPLFVKINGDKALTNNDMFSQFGIPINLQVIGILYFEYNNILIT